MPSVGSTPTTSPATSSVNSTQNDQQSNNNNNNNNNSIIYTQCNHQYHNHSSSSVNSTTAILNSGIIISDSTNNSSSTTTSCMSTPIHSPDLQLSISISSDNNPQAAALILNRYSLNSQIATVPTTMSTTATIVTSPNNTSSSSSSGTHFNYNSTTNRNPFYLSNNMQIPDSSKFLIITPAVSIDRDFDNDTGAPANDECNEIFNYPSTQMTTTNFEFNSLNNNILEKTNSSTNNSNLNNGSNNYYNEQYPNYQQHQRQNYLSNSFRFKYNSIYNQQITEKYDNNRKTENNFLSKSAANTFSGFQAAASPSSWRWCSLICAAMRCFGGGRNNTGGRSHYTSTFSTRNYTQVKDDSTSFGSGNRLSNHFTCISAASPNVSANSNTGNIKKNRNLKSSYQNNLSTNMITGTFATPRKTRDHMNNICYEL